MKTVLLLPLACAAALFSGCNTYQGGTEDTYYSESGPTNEAEPVPANPAIPESSGEAGTHIPPP